MQNKAKILILILIISASGIKAQERNTANTASKTHQEIGFNPPVSPEFETNASETYVPVTISCKTYEFKWPVEKFQFTSDTTLQVFYKKINAFNRKKGILTSLNPYTGKRFWQIKNKPLEVSMNNGQTIVNEKWLAYHVDNVRGGVDWYTDMNLFYWSDKQKTAYGVPYNRNLQGRFEGLRGVNTENGKTKWERYIDIFAGLDEQVIVNDTSHLYSAKGLYELDPRTGMGWQYDIKTYKIKTDHIHEKVGSTIAAAAFLGGAFGVFIVSSANVIPSKYITNVKSNILKTDKTIYFAGSEKIIATKHNGELIWETKIPVNEQSSSKLFLYGTTLIKINTGIVKYHRQPKRHAQPTITLLNKNTGKKLHSEKLPAWFIKTSLAKESLILGGYKSILIIDPQKLSIEVINCSKKYGAKVNHLLSEHFVTDSLQHKIQKVNSEESDIYFISYSNLYYHINVKNGSINELNTEQLFFPTGEIKNKTLYSNNHGHYILANNSGKIIKKFTIPGSRVLMNGNFITSYDKKLYFVDQQTLLETE